MPRKKLIKQNEYPYHLTSRSNNKEWFCLETDKVWLICLSAFRYAYRKCPVKLHAFVLMHNHYHMLLSTPDCNVHLFIQRFNKYFSEELGRQTNMINRKFGGPYRWSIVRSHEYLYNVHRYIYQNPLRAGLVKYCEDYVYSTLHYQVRGKKFIVPLENILDFTQPQKLQWCNFSLSPTQYDGLRKGLRSSVLTVREDRLTKKLAQYDLPPA
jgi:putative transposase